MWESSARAVGCPLTPGSLRLPSTESLPFGQGFCRPSLSHQIDGRGALLITLRVRLVFFFGAFSCFLRPSARAVGCPLTPGSLCSPAPLPSDRWERGFGGYFESSSSFSSARLTAFSVRRSIRQTPNHRSIDVRAARTFQISIEIFRFMFEKHGANAQVIDPVSENPYKD